MFNTDVEYPFKVGLREQLEIFTADGQHLGRVVDIHVSDRIGVSECLPEAPRRAEIPLDWIAWVDEAVHLTKTRQQVASSWGLLH